MKLARLTASLTLGIGVLLGSGLGDVVEAKGAVRKTAEDLSGFPLGSYADSDYDQYNVEDIKNGTSQFYNTTYIDTKNNRINLAFITTVVVEKTSKSLTLKSLKISGFIGKGYESTAYITEVWIQYNGGKVKYFTPKGTDKLLKDGVTLSVNNLNIKNIESINVHVNDNLFASAQGEGKKYPQGIIFYYGKSK
ncbi:hypothetical protein HNR63_000220 [Anoxybacillus kamchatkensis]|uniref:hypothetical protein n=1 Tax=Anoxybacillus ayderensis TaxID=265546 RepID=UPI0015EC5F32|nr:hypothetical protein [Anoxybacillus ayderensis]MBA2877193.1 hypothetical protein [Anoxybacillus ayderensis]